MLSEATGQSPRTVKTAASHHTAELRHSAAVAAILYGANQFELKRILGQKQLSTTDGYMDYAQHQLAQRHKHFSPMSKVTEPRRSSSRRPVKRRDEEA